MPWTTTHLREAHYCIADMSDVSDLFEDLQAELEDSSRNLSDIIQSAVEDPASAPNVAVELLEEAASRSQSVGELLQDFVQESDDVVGEFTDGNLFVDLGEEDFALDLDEDILLIDPTDEEFEDLLRNLDIFGIGEQLGFIPSEDR
ncbi:MAG: hypothetical protein ACI8U4_000267 [Natronomonas sp.]|jgi:hypothetical protein